MSKAVYDLAKKRYPKWWPKSYIDQLYAKKRLTKAEYEDILGIKEEEGE